MVYLRQLKIIDSKAMLKWMQNPDIVKYFSNDFSSLTIKNVEDFIKNRNDNKNNNYAIINENDDYLGTISLKNIDFKNKKAEYAIVLGAESIGKGVSKDATDLILKEAFEKLKLHKVYLCVGEDNIRAIKFYEKYGFIKEGKSKEDILRKDGKYVDLIWYYILNKE